jgi:hypothetical protein
VFFRADNPVAAVRVLKAMIGLADQNKISATHLVGSYEVAGIVLGYIACLVLPNVNAMFARWKVGLETYHNERSWSLLKLNWRPSATWAIGTSIALVAAVLINLIAGDSSQFLYFQF